MGANGDLVRYSYDGIFSAAESIDKFIKLMDTTLDEIETALKPLEQDAWKGSAAQEAYLTRKTEWRNAAAAIAEALINLKVALGDGAEGMKAADVRAAGWFGV
jgi:WXG100 family type VII secretion target